MYDLEIYVGDPYPTNLEEEAQQEAELFYDEETIRINLTRVWQLSHAEYEAFSDEFIGVIIHEFLHYFLHVKKMPQTEEEVSQLTRYLHVLSLGHLIGAGSEETDEDKTNFQRWVNRYFKDRSI